MAFLVRGLLLVFALGIALVLAPEFLARAFPLEPLDQRALKMLGSRANWESPHPYLSYFRYQRSVRDLQLDLGRKMEPQRVFNEGLPPGLDRAGNYVVAIGGNSVAQQIAIDPRYLQILSDHISRLPETKGKQVQIINLTQNAFKQPQPAIAVLLFHSYFDAYISLEGFNEAVFAQDHKHLPSHYPMAYLVVPVSQELSFQGWLWLRAFYVRFAESPSWSLLLPLHEITAKGIRAILSRWADNLAANPPGSRGEEWPVSATVMWRDSLISQAAILDKFGKKHWVFLQPNLHFEGSKIFSDEEKAFIAEGRGLNRLLNKNYKEFRDQLPYLRERGVEIIDLTQMFSKTPETVYGDYCCHFNPLGLTKMAEKMGSEISKRGKNAN